MSRLPSKARRLACDKNAVVAKALHQRTNDLDGGLRQFGKRGDGLLIFPLPGETEQSRFREFAALLQARHHELGGAEVAHLGHVPIDTGGNGRNRGSDFLKQMSRRARQQPGANGVGRLAQQLTAQLRRKIDPDSGFDR